MYESIYKWAGLDLQIKETELLRLDVPMSQDWIEYVSKLVSHSYGNNLDVRQAIFDALSPFQMASKLWVAALLTDVAPLTGSDHYVFIGSWFGQLPMLLGARNPCPFGYDKAVKTLIDKDHVAMFIAADCLQGKINKSFNFADDVFQTKSFRLSGRDTVVWTGIEHFEKDKVKQKIFSLSVKGTIFVLQGTDRPDYDHINPVTSVDDLLQYFHGGTELYSGQMETPLGTRYMIAYTT